MRDLLTCILESHTEPSSSTLAPVSVLQPWVLGDLWGLSRGGSTASSPSPWKTTHLWVYPSTATKSPPCPQAECSQGREPPQP